MKQKLSCVSGKYYLNGELLSPEEKFEDFIKSLKHDDDQTILQLMHDTMSPVNSIKGTIFLLKPMVAEKLKENDKLLGEIFAGSHKIKDDEFLLLLVKLLDGVVKRSIGRLLCKQKRPNGLSGIYPSR